MILVTGATGLVGSHLTYSLINSGHKVKAIRRPESNIENIKKVFSYYSSDYNILFNKIEWVDADLLNYSSLLKAFIGCEHIYQLLLVQATGKMVALHCLILYGKD